MKRILFFVFALITITSCKNLVPYTDALKRNNGWGEGELKRLQFYVSETIILHRELNEGSTNIVSGKIKIVKGKKVEEIIIKRGTPGILTDMPRENKMLISFEIDNDHYLSFGLNPNQRDRYTVLASDWKNEIGTVTYNGQTYMMSPDSKNTWLLVDLRRIQNLETKSRVAKGRKVD